MIARLLFAAGWILLAGAGAVAQQQAPPPEREPPPPITPDAGKLRETEARLRAEIHRQALSLATQIRTTEGEVKNYTTLPNPRALAICVFWGDITPASVPTGPFGAAWGGTNNAGRAMDFCNRYKAQLGTTRCDCTLADVNGANGVTVPPAVTERVARATP